MSEENRFIDMGLSDLEVKKRLNKYGYNRLREVKRKTVVDIAINILKEPMFILLIITALFYFFFSKELVEGLIMILSVVLMIVIEVIQEYKTDKSLEKLKELTQPKATVRRNGTLVEIDSDEVVPGDILIITEGDKICADGIILSFNDLAIDESILTGESDVIYKNTDIDDNRKFKKNHVYQGTNVVLGSAEIKVTATGKNTETGKIGTLILEAPETKAPLEKQVRKLVKIVSSFALIMLFIIGFSTYFKFHDLYKSVINGITFAISTIPEEFPVVLTIFLSLGAYRLSTKKSLIRKLSSVETLGAISVLCVDKTGTLTKNKMKVSNFTCYKGISEDWLKEISILACEKNSYDPMDQAIIKYWNIDTKELFSNTLIKEYPFTSRLKMMGHVWQIGDGILTAVKGSLESVIKICKLTDNQREEIKQQQDVFARDGYRILAVASSKYNDLSKVPNEIEECELDFLGLIIFSDPPREEVPENIKICEKAGIKVIMITGDNPITARAIGNQIGLSDKEDILTGQQIESMTDQELSQAINHTNIFARAVPEQKMKIVNAIKANGHIVAMTGDGVNDAPALKYSDIGIAMGKRGTNVAKEASDMVLLDDNFSTIVETIKDGRRIYDNISKAIRYVLTFKIPIILMTLLVPLLGLNPMLMPIHIVLLELIVDPISAIVLERQPAEKNIMTKKPRNISKQLITLGSWLRVFLQGSVIFLSTFFSYIQVIKSTGDENLARTVSLSILILSNLLLIYINSCDTKSMIYVIKEFAKDKIIWLIIGFILLFMLLLIYCSPVSAIFKTTSLNFFQLICVILISVISTAWFEGIKYLFVKKRDVD